MSRLYFDATNSFFRFRTLRDITLRSGLADTAWVFATTPQCAKCGKDWPAPYRIKIPKMQMLRGFAIPQAMPFPDDAKIVEQAMAVVCNLAVGCWIDCSCGKNFNMKCINNCVERGATDASGFDPARPGDCPCLCTCTPGCGNKKKYPCACGHRLKFHTTDCPVGLFKRDSSFIVALQRDRMRRRAEGRKTFV